MKTNIALLLLFNVMLAACKQRNQYHVKLDNTYNLQKGNKVIEKGLTVGKVTDIQLVHNNIVVAITMDEGFTLHKGTKAIVESADLLGGKVITIADNQFDGVPLRANDTIGGFSKNEAIEQLLSGKVDTLLNGKSVKEGKLNNN